MKPKATRVRSTPDSVVHSSFILIPIITEGANMTHSDLTNALQYSKINKIDFLYLRDNDVVSEKLLPLIESGTKVNCSDEKTTFIIASFDKKLRQRNIPYIIAIVFCVCMCLICIFSIVNGKASVTNISTLMFLGIPLIIALALIKLIRNRNKSIRKISGNPDATTVTVRNYPIRDMFVFYGVDDDAEYYIMLDGFAVFIGREPNLFAKKGFSLSAAVIEVEEQKYFVILK